MKVVSLGQLSLDFVHINLPPQHLLVHFSRDLLLKLALAVKRLCLCFLDRFLSLDFEGLEPLLKQLLFETVPGLLQRRGVFVDHIRFLAEAVVHSTLEVGAFLSELVCQPVLFGLVHYPQGARFVRLYLRWLFVEVCV